jgi:hypothetical protein
MGHDDDSPRPGFDHWVSFRDLGEYFNPVLKFNGQRRQVEGYDADVLTTEALRWLSDGRPKDRPFYLQLAFKPPHYPFEPAARHKRRYAGRPIPYPDTMARTARNYRTQPRWVRERRYSSVKPANSLSWVPAVTWGASFASRSTASLRPSKSSHETGTAGWTCSSGSRRRDRLRRAIVGTVVPPVFADHRISPTAPACLTPRAVPGAPHPPASIGMCGEIVVTPSLPQRRDPVRNELA